MPSTISRVTRSKAQARASYDRLSHWYDLLAGRSEKRCRDAALRKLGVQPGETALEIGCGTGHALLALARAVGDSGQVYGLDISEGMLQVSQARVEQAGLADRVRLACGDAASLPFADGLFDAIFMSFTLELFDTPEIPLVLQECRRVLRHGRRIGVVAMSARGQAGWMMRAYAWAHDRFPNYVDCRPILLQEALAEAGFQRVEATVVSMWGLPVEIVIARLPA